MPISDEFVTGGVHQQNFEGGNITWSAGDAVAKEHAAGENAGRDRVARALSAGGRARLAISGFPNSSTLEVSVTGQPDFTVTTPNGAYSWDMFFPLAAKSGRLPSTRLIPRAAPLPTATLTDQGLQRLTASPSPKCRAIVRPDSPGALLPLSVRIALRDAAGDPGRRALR